MTTSAIPQIPGGGSDEIAAHLYRVELELWKALADAFHRSYGKRGPGSLLARHYWSGLFDAFVIVSGRDGEEIHEALMEDTVARHEEQSARTADY